MASYTIPEEVVGIPLFVPDDHDQFSIVAGGMPNGDDCLRIRGDIASDYKAFQPVPATTPAIGNDGTAWDLNIWIKCPDGGGGTHLTRCFLSVMKSLSTGGVNVYSLWSLYAGGNGSIGFLRGLSSSGGNFQFGVLSPNFIRDDTWMMVTVQLPSNAEPGYLFRDEEVLPLSTDNQPSPSGTPPEDMFLCIGAYSDLGSVGGVPLDHQIGKISFHDHHLSQTERSMLYQSMTG